MSAADRSFSDVLQSIVRNVQEIVRSEVRLAKTEIREEAVKAKSASLFLGAGAVMAIFAILFLLVTIVFALSLVMPSWAAALIVGVATGDCREYDSYGRFKTVQTNPPNPRTYSRKHKGECSMGQTTHQIEAHIENTREDLGSDLHELERKVKDVTDWKQHFQN